VRFRYNIETFQSVAGIEWSSRADSPPRPRPGRARYPDVPPPPLHLIPADVEVVRIGSAPNDEQLAGASVLYIWDHRFADLAPLVRRTDELRWVHAASVGVNRLYLPRTGLGPRSPTRAVVFDTSISEWVLTAVLAHIKGLGDTWALQRESTWQYRTTGRLAGTRAAVGALARSAGPSPTASPASTSTSLLSVAPRTSIRIRDDTKLG